MKTQRLLEKNFSIKPIKLMIASGPVTYNEFFSLK
jgi:hypothetical protein